MPVEISDDEDRAKTVILNHLAGHVLTDLEICIGDDAHDPHMTLYFGDMKLNIIDNERGLLAVVSQRQPAEVEGRDYHKSSGVLQ